MKGWSGGRPESWTQVGDGTRLFTRRWRAQDAVASLLLVHGLGDHSGRYRELARRMTAVGISVTAFDLRGVASASGGPSVAP